MKFRKLLDDILKNIGIMALVALALFGYYKYQSLDEPGQNSIISDVATAKTSGTVDPDSLSADAWQSNALRVTRHYGKQVTLLGKVERIDVGEQEIKLLMTYKCSSFFCYPPGAGFNCKFPVSEASKLADFKQYDEISLRGTVSSLERQEWGPVYILQNCRLASQP